VNYNKCSIFSRTLNINSVRNMSSSQLCW